METFSASLAFCTGKSSVNSPRKDQWRGDLMLSLIYAWTNSCANTRDIGDLWCHRTHYDVIVMRWVSTLNIWLHLKYWKFGHTYAALSSLSIFKASMFSAHYIWEFLIHVILVIMDIRSNRPALLLSLVMIPPHEKITRPHHYSDAILGAMAFQITTVTIVYSTVYSGAY